MSTSARQARAVLNRLDQRVRRAMATSSNRTVDVVASQAKIYVPKATGDLAHQIEVEHTKSTIAIEASVTVADPDEPGKPAAIEFGTAHQTAQPFFRPACNRSIPPAKADMQESIRDSI